MTVLVFALLSVIIEGPKVCNSGEMVVLKADLVGAQAFKYAYTPPTSATVSADGQLAIAPKRTTKVFLVVLKDGKLEVTGHQITVRGDEQNSPNLVVLSNGNDTVKRWYEEMHFPLLKSGWRIMYLYNEQVESPVFDITLSNGYEETVTGFLTPQMIDAIKERGK